MRKSLILFILLLFSCHCIRVDDTTLNIVPEAGQTKSNSTNLAGGSHPETPGSQPSLTKGPENIKRKHLKKRKFRTVAPDKNLAKIPARPVDTLFITHLKYLQSNGIDPDLNEPVTKNYIFTPVDNRKFQSMITLSRESYLKVNFDNDILDYTDRFYTNGIKIEFISPGLQMNPVSRLMLPYWRSGTNYYGLSLVQNMFTPSTTKLGGVLYGDRPYSAYLYVGTFKITNDTAHNFRQTSELDAGIIGPNSYGEWVQRSFHNAVPTNNEPLGWQYQVQNDLVLNFMVSFEQGIVCQKNIDIVLFATGNLGTLYTNVSGGGQIRAGWLNPYFSNLGLGKKDAFTHSGLRKVQVFLFVQGSGKLVGYDATLQGGMFNKSSIYTLTSDYISHAVFQTSGGVTLSYNGIRIDVEQVILSPEFHNGWWHKWMHFALAFSL